MAVSSHRFHHEPYESNLSDARPAHVCVLTSRRRRGTAEQRRRFFDVPVGPNDVGSLGVLAEGEKCFYDWSLIPYVDRTNRVN